MPQLFLREHPKLRNMRTTTSPLEMPVLGSSIAIAVTFSRITMRGRAFSQYSNTPLSVDPVLKEDDETQARAWCEREFMCDTSLHTNPAIATSVLGTVLMLSVNASRALPEPSCVTLLKMRSGPLKAAIKCCLALLRSQENRCSNTTCFLMRLLAPRQRA